MNDKQLLEFVTESNAIEGVYDQQSIDNSIWAWNFLNARCKEEGELHPFIVMQVHEIIMKDVGAWSEPHLLTKYRGVFRDCPVYIGGREALKHQFIAPSIQSWCSGMNMRGTEGLENKEGLSRDLHVEYETIHPFVDGNGRTGRMFMNWERIQNGLEPLIIHAGAEQMEYYKWFKEKKHNG